MLAAIPSIIYGMWGLFVFAPLFQEHVQPFLIGTLGKVPGVGVLFEGPPMGIGMLTAGIILAVMVIPFITAVMRDVFELVPADAQGVRLRPGLHHVGGHVAGWCCPTRRSASSAASCWAWGARWARPWRSPS